MESSLEEILIVKTLPELTEAAMQKIQSMHPYEIPCIASWEVQVNEDYYNWMRNELNS